MHHGSPSPFFSVTHLVIWQLSEIERGRDSSAASSVQSGQAFSSVSRQSVDILVGAPGTETVRRCRSISSESPELHLGKYLNGKALLKKIQFEKLAKPAALLLDEKFTIQALLQLTVSSGNLNVIRGRALACSTICNGQPWVRDTDKQQPRMGCA
ncbi:hypothetical protein SAY87_028081 [Trapa incisa]|uniref:Uncharacterized protein n=1 Tax=Trapa incisa TaxID=236973 RepID=A0AAN7L1Y8_9MYRT|nr:hypothetical protein SAY87_028081 [Trapa incisa]